MAAAAETATRPLAASPYSPKTLSERSEETTGSVLFLGGTAYAAAYIVVGLTGLSPWGALLAIAGTVLVLFGLRSVARRSS